MGSRHLPSLFLLPGSPAGYTATEWRAPSGVGACTELRPQQPRTNPGLTAALPPGQCATAAAGGPPEANRGTRAPAPPPLARRPSDAMASPRHRWDFSSPSPPTLGGPRRVTPQREPLQGGSGGRILLPVG